MAIRGIVVKMDNEDARLLLTPTSRDLYLRILAGAEIPSRPGADLQLLVSSHLIAPDLHRPGQYEALDVDLVVQQRQASLQTMASRMLTEAQSVPTQLRELSDAYRRAHPTRQPTVEHLAGTASINDRLTQLVNDCTEELLTAQPGGPRRAHVLAASYQRDLGVLGRGATMRTIYLPTVRQDDPTARWARTMSEQGAQIRTARKFGRVIIVDRRVAITPVLARGEQDAGAIDRAAFITDETVVQLLVAAFERDWERAEPWSGEDPGVAVTDAQREILDCLGRGLEQDQAAEVLGISRRTVTNRLAELRQAARVETLGQLLFWWGRHGREV